MPAATLIEALIADGGQLYKTIKLFRAQVIIKEINRVYGIAVLADLIVTMRPGAFPGTAHPANHFTSFYGLPRPHFHAYHVAVQGFITVAMVDHHVVAVTSFLLFRDLDTAICSSINRRT